MRSANWRNVLASATREIGDLVKNIQKTVADAVKAMKEGAAEVDAGCGQSQSGRRRHPGYPQSQRFGHA